MFAPRLETGQVARDQSFRRQPPRDLARVQRLALALLERLDDDVDVLDGVVDDVTADAPVAQFRSDGDIGRGRVETPRGVVVDHHVPLGGHLHQSGHGGVVAARQRRDFPGRCTVVESGQEEDFIAARLLDRLAHRFERRGVDSLFDPGHGNPILRLPAVDGAVERL